MIKLHYHPQMPHHDKAGLFKGRKFFLLPSAFTIKFYAEGLDTAFEADGGRAAVYIAKCGCVDEQRRNGSTMWLCEEHHAAWREQDLEPRSARHDPTIGDLCPCSRCAAMREASLATSRETVAVQQATLHPKSKRLARAAEKAREEAARARQAARAAGCVDIVDH